MMTNKKTGAGSGGLRLRTSAELSRGPQPKSGLVHVRGIIIIINNSLNVHVNAPEPEPDLLNGTKLIIAA